LIGDIMKKITTTLGIFVVLSSIFLNPIAAQAEEFNSDGRAVVNMDLSRAYNPVASCNRYPYTYTTDSTSFMMSISIHNAYGATLGSGPTHFYAGSGSDSIQVCSQQDFTGPLTLAIEITGDNGATNSYRSFPFALLDQTPPAAPAPAAPAPAAPAPAPAAPAPAAPAPAAPAPAAPAPAAPKASASASVEPTPTPKANSSTGANQENSKNNAQSRTTENEMDSTSLVLATVLVTALIFGSGAFAWRRFGPKTKK